MMKSPKSTRYPESVRQTPNQVLGLIPLVGCLVISGLLPNPADAQVEMIVRVEYDSSLDRELVSASKQTSEVDLAGPGGAIGVRPLLSSRTGVAKRGIVPFPVYVLQYPDSLRLSAALEEWSNEPGVRYAQMNRLYEIDEVEVGTDPLADSLDHLEVVGVPAAWAVTAGSAEVTVGLVDTGVRRDHPDLDDQFVIRSGEDLNGDGQFDSSDINGIDDDGNGFIDDVSGYDFVDRPQTVEPGDFRDPDPFADDDGSGHGTNVAGIVAAVRNNLIGITGIAPGVRLVPLRAFGRDGRGDDDDVAQAVIYAAENGISVLNLSFGDTHISPLMHEAIRYAVDRGVVIVASAGNAGGDSPHYPSDYPEAISVAWLSGDGVGLAPRATSGVGVDIGAPGSAVFTTTIPLDDTEPETAYYGRRSGSSMAAPMVAAAAALIRSVDPSLTPASVRSAIVTSAVDLGEPGWDHSTGSGLLNVGGAVTRALPARVEIDSPLDDSGISNGPVEVVGTAVDPSFISYRLYYAAGDADLTAQSWQPIGEARFEQVFSDLLGAWDIDGLEAGLYTLRLSVSLRTGHTIDERRRIYIDRSPPTLSIHLLERSIVQGRYGVMADVRTDDVSDVEMRIDIDGTMHRVESLRRARRHGLVWSDGSLSGGSATVTIRATNTSGLVSEESRTVFVPASSVNTALLDLSSPVGPDGFLLDTTVDLDGDDLKEVVLNVYEDGWLGDTLAVLEWDGSLFRRASSVVAGVIPRAAGDSDGDGLTEVLTQIGPATVLLEQGAGLYLEEVAFVDTTGLTGNQTDSFWGGGLADLDGDGRSEIIGHNTRQWRLLEWTGTTYEEVARLDNPTGVSDSELGENTFEQPYPVVGDFDGDDRTDLLVGDSDGDWILYEATGDNAFGAVWTFETERYDAGSRFAVGDLDGDGDDEFVGYEHNWLSTTGDGEREPDIGRYTVFENTGDNAYEPVQHFLASGEISRHGSMTSLDVDADGRDELVIVNPPDLYVVAFDNEMRWSLAYHAGLDAPPGFEGFRSIRTLTADLDADGRDELVVADAAGSLRVLRVAAPSLPPPAWVDAFALDEASVKLSWRGFGADSVEVFRADLGGTFDPVSMESGSMRIDSVTSASEYVLRAWFAGVASPLSRSTTVRPHRPGTAAMVRRLSGERFEIEFTEPLDPTTRAEQFSLDAQGPASSVLVVGQGNSVVIDFKGASSSADTLRWYSLVDVEGTPLHDGALYVESAPDAIRSLIVESWSIDSPTRIRLTFSAPLEAESARQRANYRIEPAGEVRAVAFDEGMPRQVHVEVSGAAIGATGLTTSITVVAMRSTDGSELAPEGNTILLSSAASDLADVYVFPNPFRAGGGGRGVMIAGLPETAFVEVFSVDGTLVRRLEEIDGDGGVLWDIRDETGSVVPSGVYLVLVKSKGLGSVLKKAAIIQ